MDLIIIGVCSVFLLPLALLTSGAPRVILALPFVLFFPGYALVASLFPQKERFDGIERVALGIGCSLVVVPLIGLVVNVSPWGIRFEPFLFSLFGFILAMIVIATYRRTKLAPQERFGVNFGWMASRFAANWASKGLWDRLLVVLLAVVVVGTISSAVRITQASKVSERFTEFYILGPLGKAMDYPREVVLGRTSQVITGIVNQEQKTVAYHVEIDIDGQKVGQVGPMTLDNHQKWEELVTFSATKLGQNQKVEFQLYRGDESKPYRTVHLWLDVM